MSKFLRSLQRIILVTNLHLTSDILVFPEGIVVSVPAAEHTDTLKH